MKIFCQEAIQARFHRKQFFVFDTAINFVSVTKEKHRYFYPEKKTNFVQKLQHRIYIIMSFDQNYQDMSATAQMGDIDRYNAFYYKQMQQMHQAHSIPPGKGVAGVNFEHHVQPPSQFMHGGPVPESIQHQSAPPVTFRGQQSQQSTALSGHPVHHPYYAGGQPYPIFVSPFHPMPLLPFDQVQAMMHYYMTQQQQTGQSNAPLQQKQVNGAEQTNQSSLSHNQVYGGENEPAPQQPALRNDGKQKPNIPSPKVKKHSAAEKQTKQTKEPVQSEQTRPDQGHNADNNDENLDAMGSEPNAASADSPWANSAKLKVLRAAEPVNNVDGVIEPIKRGRVAGRQKRTNKPVRGPGRGRGRGRRNSSGQPWRIDDRETLDVTKASKEKSV